MINNDNFEEMERRLKNANLTRPFNCCDGMNEGCCGGGEELDMDKTLAFIRAELLRRDEYWKEKLVKVREKAVEEKTKWPPGRLVANARRSGQNDIIAILDAEIKDLSDERGKGS